MLNRALIELTNFEDMNKQATIQYLKSSGFDEPENVKEWSELSYEEHMRIARILDENGYRAAIDVISDQDNEPEEMSPFVSFRYLAFCEDDQDSLQEFIGKVHPTYDVQFDDDDNTNSKGWRESYDYCKDYIESNNGTNNSYFVDYKGGTVSIVCNETGEIVYHEEVK